MILTRTSTDIPWYEEFYTVGTPERDEFDYYTDYFNNIPNVEYTITYSDDLLVATVKYTYTDFDYEGHFYATPAYQEFMDKVCAYYNEKNILLEFITEY